MPPKNAQRPHRDAAQKCHADNRAQRQAGYQYRLTLISGTPRPASQATNMPTNTAASIFQLIKLAKPGD